MPQINPKLGVFNVTVAVDGDAKKAGDKITQKQADELEGRMFHGMPLAVSGGKVKKAESDED